MKTTYHGSCQCKRVAFEADIDFAVQGTGKCNCTSCVKRRWWATQIPVDSFRSLGGETELSEYQAGATVQSGFCKHCGITPYAYVAKQEWNDGEKVSVNVATLDDVDPQVLAESPIQYMDGRADNWGAVPAYSKHL